MLEHRYDLRISESCVGPNRLMVERQDPDNFPRLQTRERCALEIAAYVFNVHAQKPLKRLNAEISNGARGLNFGLCIILSHHCVDARSDCSGETVHMHKIV